MLHLVHGSVAQDWLLQLWGAQGTHAWSTLQPSVNSSRPSVPPRSLGKPVGMGLDQSITCSLEGWISPPPTKWEKLLRLVRGRGSWSAPRSSSSPSCWYLAQGTQTTWTIRVGLNPGDQAGWTLTCIFQGASSATAPSLGATANIWN